MYLCWSICWIWYDFGQKLWNKRI